MKKNWIARIGFLALVLTLVTASLVSGTFAKYTTAVSGKDTVRVAKFDVAVGDGATTFTTGTAIDIFTMAADTGVAEIEGIIAPGTTGDFGIEIENKSEVKVSAALAFEETNTNNVPIYYVYNTQRYSSVLTGTYTGDNNGTYKTLAGLAADMVATPIKLDVSGGTVDEATLALDWYWAFNTAGTGQTDVSDTTLGKAATAPEVTLNITVTATQLDE